MHRCRQGRSSVLSLRRLSKAIPSLPAGTLLALLGIAALKTLVGECTRITFSGQECRTRSDRVLSYTRERRKQMSRKIAALVVSGILFSVGSADAQESNPGPGVVEVTYIPAGAAY